MNNKLCITCGKQFELGKYNHNQKYCSKSCSWKNWDSKRPESRNDYVKDYRKKWISNPDNKKKQRDYQREWSREALIKRKKEIFNKYGNKCNKCGFTDFRALQIDHVNGGGLKDFKTNYQTGKSRGRRDYYKAVLKDDTNKYQLLCANCNWIKKYDRKEF